MISNLDLVLNSNLYTSIFITLGRHNIDKIDEIFKFIEENISCEIMIDSLGNKSYINDNFTLCLNNSELALRFKNEDYNQNFNYDLVFEVLSNSNWAAELFQFAGLLLRYNDGACLIESNGDIPVLYRENTDIYVDDSKLHGIGLPFDLLGMKYYRKDLEWV